MNPNHGKYLDVVYSAHDGCQYEPTEKRGALITDAHFRQSRASVLVGSRDPSTGIQYRLCAECASMPPFNGRDRRRRPITEAK